MWRFGIGQLQKFPVNGDLQTHRESFAIYGICCFVMESF